MPKTIANCPAEAVGGRAALEEALAAAGVVPDFRRVFNPNYDFEDYDDPSNEDYFLGLARHSPYGSDEIIISAATIEHTLYLPLIGEAGEYDNVVEFPHETGPDGPFISAAAIAAIVERAKRLATHAAKTNRRLEGLTWRKAREAARGDDALTVAMARAALQRALRIRAGDTSNSHSPHDMTDFLDCHLAVLRLLPETQIAATLDMPAPATLLPLPIELRVHRPYEDVAATRPSPIPVSSPSAPAMSSTKASTRMPPASSISATAPEVFRFPSPKENALKSRFSPEKGQ